MRHAVRVVLGPAVGGVVNTDVALVELTTLLAGVVAGEICEALVIILTVGCETEGLVDVTDLSGQVVVTLRLPHEAEETADP